MQDFKQAKANAEEVARLGEKVDGYLADVERVLKAADEVVGAAEAVVHNGEPGMWVPASEWRDLKEAYERAW